MEKLVIDTNVWYEIGDQKNRTLIDIIQAYELVGTHTSLWEMCKTKMLNTRFQFVQKGMGTFVTKIDFGNQSLNPLAHLALLSGFEISSTIYNDWNKWYELAHATANSHVTELPDWLKDSKVERYENLKLIEKQGIDQINLAAESDRERIKNEGLLNFNFGPSIKRYLAKLVEIGVGHNEGTISLDWQKFELLEKTFTALYTDMVKTGRRLKTNDIRDLLQLAYVQPRMKYFTYEKKWIKFIESANCKDYLLPQTAILIQEHKEKSKEMHSNRK